MSGTSIRPHKGASERSGSPAIEDWGQYPHVSSDELRTAPSVLYHVAPQGLREVIQSEGLRPDDEADYPGVYFHDNLQSARRTQKEFESIRETPHDIWEVASDGISLLPDPYAGSSWVSEQPISPGSTKLAMAEPTDFTDFFTDATQGAYAPAYQPQYNFEDPQHQKALETFQEHAGNFDVHIDTSIPDYRGVLIRTAVAISQAFPGAHVLDIGGSEGSWGKTVSALGGQTTVNLDPNPAMHQYFTEKSQVPGATMQVDYFPVADSTAGEYDVIHESMTFQFISNERPYQVAEVKRILKPGGLFICNEKVITENYAEGEFGKDMYKAQFYSPEQLKTKQEVVNVQGDQHTGMMANMVTQEELEEILHENFASVEPYWESFNFKGYACSNDPSTVQRFLSAYNGNAKPTVTPKMAKTAMAERTGDPELDALLQEFMAGVWDDDQSWWPASWEELESMTEEVGIDFDREMGDELPIRAFQHPGISEGMCYLMAEKLADFLAERGIDAFTTADVSSGSWTHDFSKYPWGGRDPTPQDWGLMDAPQLTDHNSHHWVIVERPTGTFGIDFTASQFNEKEFPLVQRFDQGGWQRKWSASWPWEWFKKDSPRGDQPSRSGRPGDRWPSLRSLMPPERVLLNEMASPEVNIKVVEIMPYPDRPDQDYGIHMPYGNARGQIILRGASGSDPSSSRGFNMMFFRTGEDAMWVAQKIIEEQPGTVEEALWSLGRSKHTWTGEWARGNYWYDPEHEEYWPELPSNAMPEPDLEAVDMMWPNNFPSEWGQKRGSQRLGSGTAIAWVHSDVARDLESHGWVYDDQELPWQSNLTAAEGWAAGQMRMPGGIGEVKAYQKDFPSQALAHMELLDLGFNGDLSTSNGALIDWYDKDDPDKMSLMDIVGDPRYASMIRLGASVEELAKETIESIMGYEGKGGHKPPRPDIQKMKDVYDLWLDTGYGLNQALRELNIDLSPSNSDLASGDPGDVVDAVKKEWEDNYILTPTEKVLYRNYQHFHPTTPAEAFDRTITWAQDAVAGASLNEAEAKKLLGSAIKKHQQQWYPLLYQQIKNALDDAYRRGPYESYKMWPRMVSWIKDDFQRRLNNNDLRIVSDDDDLNRLPDQASGRLPINHIVDIATEGGELLNRLRRENRLPQGMDANQMSFNDFEEWLMQWKRDNREAEAQGETVYEFKDGWTIQRLTTEAQLQYEGDVMNHCVGGYAPEAESGRALIYSLRDEKGKPHVTIEMEGFQAWVPDPADAEKDTSPYSLGHFTVLNSKDDVPRWEDLQPPVFHEDMELVKNLMKQRHEEFPDSRQFRNTYVHPFDNGEYYEAIGNGAVVPMETTEYPVVQVQGANNTTPKPEYQRKIREFLDYLRGKGKTFSRSENWYDPHDARVGDDEEGAHFEQQREHYQDGRLWNEWVDAYSNDQKSWTHGGEDVYGLNREPKQLRFADEKAWITTMAYSLIDAYDRYQWTERDPLRLAQEFYHAYMISEWQGYGSWANSNVEQRVKDDLEALIEYGRDAVDQWERESLDYVPADSYYEKYQELHGEVPEEHEDYTIGEMHEQAFDVGNAQWEATVDAVREENGEAYEKAYDFFRYLEELNDQVGALHPHDLPSIREPNMGLPSLRDLLTTKRHPLIRSEQTGEIAIPGALSKRIAMAADPEWWAEFSKTHKFYHGTSMAAYEKMKQEGLAPQGAGASNWEPASGVSSRPGFVYLTTDPGNASQYTQYINWDRHLPESESMPFKIPGEAMKTVVIEIDPQYLDPALIYPDEDFLEELHYQPIGEHWSWPAGLSDTLEEWRARGDLGLGSRADAVGWGEKPPHTHFGIESFGNVAYRGVIPPQALRLVTNPNALSELSRIGSWNAKSNVIEVGQHDEMNDESDDSVWRPGYLFLNSGNIYIGPNGVDHYTLSIPWQKEMIGEGEMSPYVKINVYTRDDPYSVWPQATYVQEDMMQEFPVENPRDITVEEIMPFAPALKALSTNNDVIWVDEYGRQTKLAHSGALPSQIPYDDDPEPEWMRIQQQHELSNNAIWQLQEFPEACAIAKKMQAQFGVHARDHDEAKAAVYDSFSGWAASDMDKKMLSNIILGIDWTNVPMPEGDQLTLAKVADVSWQGDIENRFICDKCKAVGQWVDFGDGDILCPSCRLEPKCPTCNGLGELGREQDGRTWYEQCPDCDWGVWYGAVAATNFRMTRGESDWAMPGDIDLDNDPILDEALYRMQDEWNPDIPNIQIVNAYDDENERAGSVVFFPLTDPGMLDMAGLDHPTMWVEWIYVDPRYKNTNLFIQLMMEVKRDADAAGMPIDAYYANPRLEKVIERLQARYSSHEVIRRLPVLWDDVGFVVVGEPQDHHYDVGLKRDVDAEQFNQGDVNLAVADGMVTEMAIWDVPSEYHDEVQRQAIDILNANQDAWQEDLTQEEYKDKIYGEQWQRNVDENYDFTNQRWKTANKDEHDTFFETTARHRWFRDYMRQQDRGPWRFYDGTPSDWPRYLPTKWMKRFPHASLKAQELQGQALDDEYKKGAIYEALLLDNPNNPTEERMRGLVDFIVKYDFRGVELDRIDMTQIPGQQQLDLNPPSPPEEPEWEQLTLAKTAAPRRLSPAQMAGMKRWPQACLVAKKMQERFGLQAIRSSDSSPAYQATIAAVYDALEWDVPEPGKRALAKHIAEFDWTNVPMEKGDQLTLAKTASLFETPKAKTLRKHPQACLVAKEMQNRFGFDAIWNPANESVLDTMMAAIYEAMGEWGFESEYDKRAKATSIARYDWTNVPMGESDQLTLAKTKMSWRDDDEYDFDSRQYIAFYYGPGGVYFGERFGPRQCHEDHGSLTNEMAQKGILESMPYQGAVNVLYNVTLKQAEWQVWPKDERWPIPPELLPQIEEAVKTFYEGYDVEPYDQRNEGWAKSTTAKTAATTMYHTTWAPHEIVMRDGINYEQGGQPSEWVYNEMEMPRGNYLWDNPDSAIQYGNEDFHVRPFNIYRVNASGLHLAEDPWFDKMPDTKDEWQTPSGHPGAFYTLDPIPPDRLEPVHISILYDDETKQEQLERELGWYDSKGNYEPYDPLPEHMWKAAMGKISAEIRVEYGGDYMDYSTGKVMRGDDANVAVQAWDRGKMVGSLWAEIPHRDADSLTIWQAWIDPEYRNSGLLMDLGHALKDEFDLPFEATRATDLDRPNRDIRVGMAADPEWVKNWIARRGPYLYHGAGVRSGMGEFSNGDEMAQSILSNGIVPGGDNRPNEVPQAQNYDWSGYDTSQFQYPGEWDGDMYEWWLKPRPGHVFLTTSPDDAYGTHLFRIDIRGLDPANFNPDDDYMREKEDTIGPHLLPGHDYGSGIGRLDTWDDVQNTLKTLGDQAEELNWGSNPQDTHDSWEASPIHGSGVVAYRGVIPPHLIQLVGTRDNQYDEWEPF